MSLRNVGTGPAILHGWVVHPEQLTSAVPHPALEDFHALTRDIYVAAGDFGFWQGALRDPHAEEFGPVRRVIESGGIMTVDLLYGDIEGGQRDQPLRPDGPDGRHLARESGAALEHRPPRPTLTPRTR
jgi:hypothetical protein